MFSDVIWIASLENKAHVHEAKNATDSPKKDVVYETGPVGKLTERQSKLSPASLSSNNVEQE